MNSDAVNRAGYEEACVHLRKVVDTDDLTEMAYQMIPIAGDISDYLRCDIGARCHAYRNENDYLSGTLVFLKKIVQYPKNYLESWNLDDIDPQHFKAAVLRLVKHVSKTIATPIANRGATAFE